MNKLHGIKAATVGAIAFLSLSVLSASSAVAQEKQKPVAQTQKPAAQTEQMSGCECCKKMMEKKMNDSQNKMPGTNHSAPSGN
ncbi:hypothetical protein JOY44_11105 [Phormidium sp. CLA17]|uniref:hypothetical protein n=1 Tax=Leptolyngbya sp. Cla-17 TaxID=2803751 RepID=UPI001491ED64|nr:hypothetical protein [Leptolyngbya sp. Cla-17]MBM0742162.1 hypothetical protein [Leptolyngbya sp. Cla-17]